MAEAKTALRIPEGPEYLQDDIRKSAVGLVGEVIAAGNDKRADMATAFMAAAVALLRERERCALIAETYDRRDPDDHLDPDAAIGRNVCARQIATAIRQGEPGLS